MDAPPVPDTAPLPVVVTGHVDHGKSTLLGRLLAETGALPEGRVEALRAMAAREGLAFEWAFVLDALLEEQNQNVTIETTRLRFRTAAREYEVIDAPGHVEFLRNMVTGAAAATAALLVVDAVRGVEEQTRRHAALLGLLAIRQAAVVVNKMDLAADGGAGPGARARFAEVAAAAAALLREAGVEVTAAVPVVARDGDNLVGRGPRLAWWEGPTVAGVLDGFAGPVAPGGLPLRFSIQDVYREGEARHLAGRVEAGEVRAGDEVLLAPAGRRAVVRGVHRWPEPGPPRAGAGEAVTITLDRPLYASRGMVVAPPAAAPCEHREVRARVFWLDPDPLPAGASVRVRLLHQDVRAEVMRIGAVTEPGTLARREEAGELRAHEVGEVTLWTARPLVFDPFAEVAATGRIVLYRGRRPGGGGTILPGAYPRAGAGAAAGPDSAVFWTEAKVTHVQRAALNGHPGLVVWFTGLSGAGKSTLAMELERRLGAAGRHTYLLDGDNLRHGLCADLGFSRADRRANVRRAAAVAALMAAAGLVVLAALISPFADDRAYARGLVPAGRFVEVHVRASVDVCRRRDPKGLYDRALRGEIAEFTGVSSPYEAPESPELDLPTGEMDVEACLTALLDLVNPLLRLDRAAAGGPPAAGR